MASDEKDVLDSIDSSNIFDEFETWALNDELQSVKKEKKTLYDYLSMWGKVLSVIFWIGLIATIVAYSYVFIQNDETKDNSTLLSPICFIFMWDTPGIDNKCSSITSLNSSYNKKLDENKKSQFNQVNSLLEEAYKIENFNKSKEIIFLTTQSQNKIPVTQLLNDFDDLIYNYDSSKLNQIKCDEMSINSEMIVSMNCNTYTWDSDRSIRWLSWNEKITGTSITLANSFLYYIENNSEKFIIQDKQKTFSKESYFSEDNPYSKKTNFELIMQYIPSNNLNTK